MIKDQPRMRLSALLANSINFRERNSPLLINVCRRSMLLIARTISTIFVVVHPLNHKDVPRTISRDCFMLVEPRASRRRRVHDADTGKRWIWLRLDNRKRQSFRTIIEHRQSLRTIIPLIGVFLTVSITTTYRDKNSHTHTRSNSSRLARLKRCVASLADACKQRVSERPTTKCETCLSVVDFVAKEYVHRTRYQLGQLDFGSRCEKPRNIHVDKTLWDAYVNRSGVSSARKERKKEKERKEMLERCC